jgi:hypothetical protein
MIANATFLEAIMDNFCFDEVAQIMNGQKNYFGPDFDEFLKKNPRMQPYQVSDEEKLRMLRNQGKINFFGPNEWSKFFQRKIDLDNVPKIPWTKEELENPIIKAPHFLFLSTGRLVNKNITIPLLQQEFTGPTHPKFYYSLAHDLNSEINTRICEKRWFLMQVDGYGKPGLLYEDLAFSLPFEYKPAHAVERVLGNILFYLLNHVYLDSDFTLVNDVLDPKSGIAMISSFQSDGILIDSDEASPYSAIAATRLTTDEIIQKKGQLKGINKSIDDIMKSYGYS